MAGCRDAIATLLVILICWTVTPIRASREQTYAHHLALVADGSTEADIENIKLSHNAGSDNLGQAQQTTRVEG